MTHITWTEDPTPIVLEADYVVVGTGAGGALAASTLARAGYEVAMVEAGPWRDPEDYPSTVYGSLRDLSDEWMTGVTRGRAMWPVVQGRVVGGSTVINSAIVVRTPGDIFAEWEREHGFGGDGLAERVWTHQDLIEEELSVEESLAGVYGNSNALARKGAVALGIHDHDMRRNVSGCEGAGQCLQGCRKRRKQSTNLVYVPEVLSRAGTLLSCAPVSRVILEHGRALGVSGRLVEPGTRRKGAPFVVHAHRGVLMGASATHTSPILARSGYRHPALGSFFRAHPGTAVFGVYDDVVDMNTGATQGWASTYYRSREGFKMETLSLPLELTASRLPGVGLELLERLTSYRHLAMWVHAIRAETVGSVRPAAFGRSQVSYSMIQADMERARFGVHTVARMHVAAGAREVLPGIYGLPASLGPDEIDLILEAPLDPRCYIGVLSHLFGGTVMGADPKRSVCDPRGRVRGVEGLAVVDASIIPSTLGVNPQHTIMALARCVAEDLIEG
jgi:choline dehydrogenase-like flavoprotein